MMRAQFHRILKRYLWCLSVLLLASCSEIRGASDKATAEQGTGTNDNRAITLFSLSHCGALARQSGVIDVSSEDAFAGLLETLPPNLVENLSDDGRLDDSQSFDYRVLLVAELFRTAGYRLELSRTQPLVPERTPAGNILRVPVQIHSPDPDTMQAQMMSRPCLAIGLSLDPGISTVRFDDDSGGVMGSLALPDRTSK